MRGYNDDLIMAMAIGCWVRDTALVANKRDAEYSKALLDGISRSDTTLDTNIRGQVGYDKRREYEAQLKELEPFLWVSKG